MPQAGLHHVHSWRATEPHSLSQLATLHIWHSALQAAVSYNTTPGRLYQSALDSWEPLHSTGWACDYRRSQTAGRAAPPPRLLLLGKPDVHSGGEAPMLAL